MIWEEPLKLEKLSILDKQAQNQLVDHLFRHSYGKMIAILSKIFGLSNLELIEDSIQDTFLKASLKWRAELPKNPEAWLVQAAKNRVIDLLRKVNAQKKRDEKIVHGTIALAINEYFLPHEVADSQLRMIFVACHPVFSQEEQITFALKAISGFSRKEIAAALLQKEETIKKRMYRARKKIREQSIDLEFPKPAEIQSRLSGVLQVIYLIFNEGFHSTKSNQLLDKELCGEAIRLCKLLLTKEQFRSGSLYALFALLCFHAARMDAKVQDGQLIDLKQQDRSLWYKPMIYLGYDAFAKTMEYQDHSIYHLEAAIAFEHLKASTFDETNWTEILALYQEIYRQMPSDSILLSMISVYINMGALEEAAEVLVKVKQEALHAQKYLYHGCYAELYYKMGETERALVEMDLAIAACSNQLEKAYLTTKKKSFEK